MNELIDIKFYSQIKSIPESARGQVYKATNAAMVMAYWQIDKNIVEQQGGDERADYGARLISELSKRLTTDFGKGFDERNLRNMRAFYLAFPNWNTVCTELTWSHYRTVLRVENAEARNWYIREAASEGWSVRQFDRQISRSARIQARTGADRQFAALFAGTRQRVLFCCPSKADAL